MSLQSIRSQNNNADSRQSKLQLSSYPNKLNAENSKNWRDDAKGNIQNIVIEKWIEGAQL